MWLASLILLLAGVFTGNPFFLVGGVVAFLATAITRQTTYRPELRCKGSVVATVADLCRAAVAASGDEP
jgi:hypothetical protein